MQDVLTGSTLAPRMRPRALLPLAGTLLVAAATVVLFACKLSLNGDGAEGPDGSVADGGGDSGAQDALPDTTSADVIEEEESDGNCGSGFVCGSGCVPPGASPCDSCSAGHLVCNATQSCVADCASCPGSPVICCSAQGSPSGACLTSYQVENDYDGGCPTSEVRCPCAGDDAGACPGSKQVCEQGACNACGENPGTDGLTCHASGRCNSDGGACQ